MKKELPPKDMRLKDRQPKDMKPNATPLMRFLSRPRNWLKHLRFAANSRAVPGLLLGALLLATTSAHAVGIHEQTLKRAQWPSPANGYNVLALPAVTKTLRRFEENGKNTVIINYPGGDPGKQWGIELYNWLVSFGIPTRYLELQPGSGAADRLVITLIERD